MPHVDASAQEGPGGRPVEGSRGSGDGSPGEEVLAAVTAAVGSAMGIAAGEVGVRSVSRLSGGASRLTWAVATEPGGEVIVQRERPGSSGVNLPMAVQAELLRRAGSHGVPVPEVLAEGGQQGSGFVVMARVEGESVPGRIRADPDLAPALAGVAGQVGEACARIHAMDAGGLGDGLPAPEPLGSMRRLLDGLGEPHPAFEAALAHLERTRPGSPRRCVVHGDLRMGNLLVGPSGVTAVLDWELAHISDPGEDLGWFCARAWRFGSPLRAGGVGTVEELLAGYEAAGGIPPTPSELSWWEAYACLRWGLICVLQASVHLSGAHRSAELAAIGRRAAECEEDVLALIWGPSAYEPPAVPLRARVPPHDAPGASELLVAVAEQLEAMRARVRGADRFGLRVAANVIEMVDREVAFGGLLASRHAQRLEDLGMADDAELARSIRSGDTDDRDPQLRSAVRASVRDKLAVANPGYWEGDGDP